MFAHQIKGKRRILTDFVIDKIAAVDNPCQEHALVAIIKRAPDDVDEQRKRSAKMAQHFPGLVTQIQKRDGCTRYDALMTAAIENPEAVEAYRTSSPVRTPEIVKREEAIAKRYEKQANIDKRTREVMSRDRVDRTQALLTLQDEEPEVFEA